MNVRMLLLSAGLLVAAYAVATSQPQPPPIPSPRLDFAPPATPPTPTAPPSVAIPTPPPAPTPPPEKTVDDLLGELERVQMQKVELEKKEQALKATLQKKLETQAERLKKLGVTPKDERQPDRVGRIIIEGNTKTKEEKILEMVGLLPGQVLQYPALDAARAKLEKAGFRGVSVEVIPNDRDSTFKDIRVKVSEPKPEPAPAPAVRG